MSEAVFFASRGRDLWNDDFVRDVQAAAAEGDSVVAVHECDPDALAMEEEASNFLRSVARVRPLVASLRLSVPPGDHGDYAARFAQEIELRDGHAPSEA